MHKKKSSDNTSVDHAIRVTWQAISKMYNEVAHRHGATMATGFALLYVDPENGTPSTSLGPKMGMEATSLSRTLKTMEEKGLICRKPNPLDRRSVLICLTDYGKEMREVSKSYVIRFNEKISEFTSPEELKTFYKVMDIINEVILEKDIYLNSAEDRKS